MQLSGLEPGERLITIRAWDNVNNLSTRLLTLNVVESGDLRITDVMNYPNPFEGPTTFTFELTQDADITVQVYTVAGTLIHAVDGVPGFRGFNQIPWNGLDRDGGRLANGAYLYRLTARSRTPDRKTASVYGKMLVVR
jgi:hypothetical protein